MYFKINKYLSDNFRKNVNYLTCIKLVKTSSERNACCLLLEEGLPIKVTGMMCSTRSD